MNKESPHVAGDYISSSRWGDEEKGKWCDVLSKEADLVVRFQGGNIWDIPYTKKEKRLLFINSCAVFCPHSKLALAATVVVNPLELLKEIENLSSFVTLSKDRLWISGALISLHLGISILIRKWNLILKT